MIYSIPIEPYENRYSSLWNRWFPAYFEQHSIPYYTIQPKRPSKQLDSKEVLSTFDTQLNKISQLQKIIRLIRDGRISYNDVLLFHTIWFEGIEALQYIRDSTGIAFRIVGVLHAGTYDPNDFRVRKHMVRWARGIEQGWLELVDLIFVGSHYHKALITSSFAIDPVKVIVTRLPIDERELTQDCCLSKENIVLFPHRDVPEKNPGLVDRLRMWMPEFQIIRTRDVCRTRSEYINLLKRSKVAISGSYQETFGYSMLEAALCGCVPIVPNRLCYVEMYPGEYRYDDEKSIVSMIRKFMVAPENPGQRMSGIIGECNGALGAMIRAINGVRG